ncbi:MAG: hypothetical protein QXW34_02390 [Candidatus Methanomethyliaceae archaeon]
MLGPLYLFGLKAVVTSLTRDIIGNAIWHVADLKMTAHEGIEIMNERINTLSSLLDKPLLLLLLYSLILILASIVMIKSHFTK